MMSNRSMERGRINFAGAEATPGPSGLRTALGLWAILTLIVAALMAVPADAASRRREEQKVQEDLDKARAEVQLYQKQLEEVRVKRWQDKRNAIAAQEAFSEAWNEIKADIDRLGQMKDQKEETLLRLQSQEAEKRSEVEEQENRLKQFGLQVRDKLIELGGEWEKGFPHRSLEKTSRLTVVQKGMEKGDPASPAALQTLLELAHEDWLDGETREISRDKLAVKGVAAAQGLDAEAAKLDPASQAKMVAGYRIRLGQAFEAFVSTESEDVAILGKTGRIDAKSWEWIEDLPDGVRKTLRESVLGLASGNREMALVPMDVLLTKATGEGFTTKTRNSMWTDFKHEFEGGGWVMYPIFGLGLVGIFIILFKTVVFLSRDQRSKRLAARVQSLAAEGRLEEAKQACRRSKGSVGRVLLAALENSDGPREDAEARAHEVMLHEAPVLEKFITTMNILAAAAPLVGLLGTVTGMVTLFDVITVHGTGNPKLMAGGISEALIATKWGLGTAIPLLIAYNLLDNWAVRVTTNMEKYAARLINTLYLSRRRVAEHV